MLNVDNSNVTKAGQFQPVQPHPSIPSTISSIDSIVQYPNLPEAAPYAAVLVGALIDGD